MTQEDFFKIFQNGQNEQENSEEQSNQKQTEAESASDLNFDGEDIVLEMRMELQELLFGGLPDQKTDDQEPILSKRISY